MREDEGSEELDGEGEEAGRAALPIPPGPQLFILGIGG